MNHDADIVITGIGLITPLANGATATWDALLAGRFITGHGRSIDRRSFAGEEPNVIELADIAAREALAAARWGHARTRSDRTALVVGTSKGPADEWLAPVEDVISSEGVISSRATGLLPVSGARGVGEPHFFEPVNTAHGSEAESLENPARPLAVRSVRIPGHCEPQAIGQQLLRFRTQQPEAGDTDLDQPPTSDNPSSPFIPAECSVTPGQTLPVAMDMTVVAEFPVDRRLRLREDEYAIHDDSAREAASGWGLHQIAQVLAKRLQLGKGPRLTTSAACASGLHALIRAAMLLQHGDADRALVVASESSLHPVFIQSFRRLGVLASEGEPCRPFDRNRGGFLIREAAAAVVLERRRGKPGEIVLDGYALGADASHLTGTDPAAFALRHCLAKVIAARPVDLIHAHATGTIANDPIELAAIESVSDGSAILYSHKGAIGHTLGASGLVATVLNVLAHRRGLVPGNVNTLSPLVTQAGRIAREAIRRRITRSLTIAAGFGGATAVAALRTA